MGLKFLIWKVLGLGPGDSHRQSHHLKCLLGDTEKGLHWKWAVLSLTVGKRDLPPGMWCAPSGSVRSYLRGPMEECPLEWWNGSSRGRHHWKTGNRESKWRVEESLPTSWERNAFAEASRAALPISGPWACSRLKQVNWVWSNMIICARITLLII